MSLIKFMTISLCCKFYVRSEYMDLQNIMINNNCSRNAIWICVDDGMKHEICIRWVDDGMGPPSIGETVEILVEISLQCKKKKHRIFTYQIVGAVEFFFNIWI